MVIYQSLRRFLIPQLPIGLLPCLFLPSWLRLFLHHFLAIVVVVEIVDYFLVLLDLMHTLSRFTPLCI
jgi:hypothetical protein